MPRKNPHKPFEEHIRETAPMVAFVRKLMDEKPTLTDQLTMISDGIKGLATIKIKMPDGTTHELHRDEVFQKLYTESHTHESMSQFSEKIDSVARFVRAIFFFVGAIVTLSLGIAKIALPLIHGIH